MRREVNHLALVVVTTCWMLCTAAAAETDGDDGDSEPTIFTGKEEKRTNKMLDRVLESVDFRIRPNLTGPATTIQASMMLTSFGSVDEVNMDYSITIFFRMKWMDPRLEFPNELVDSINVPAAEIHRVWKPDIIFSNEKEAHTHEVIVPNMFLWIYNNGTVFYSIRLTLKLGCPMDLSSFPMDRQRCEVNLETYASTTADVLLEWKGSGEALEMDRKMSLPQFDLYKTRFHTGCVKNYATGQFSCLRASFWLERQFGFYLLQTYIPSVLIVILSWVSFWINMDTVPARISLGVTTVLTMTTQLSGSKGSIPRVSYPKAIDVWMSICMLFVFAALLEYAFVNALSRKHKDAGEHKKDDDNDIKPDDDAEEGESDAKAAVKNLPAIGHAIKKYDTWKDMYKKRQMASLLDKVSRGLFPGLFFIFNLIYWPYYMRSDI